MVDIKPDTMEELTEVVTCAEHHPTDPSLIIYATSRGTINIIDTRMRSTFDRNVVQKLETPGLGTAASRVGRSMVLHSDPHFNHPECAGSSSGPTSQLNRIVNASSGSPAPQPHSRNTSFFSEMISSVTDLQISSCGRHLATRDFMSVKLWDLRAPSKRMGNPVCSIPVHDHIKPLLTTLYEADAIFDKFLMALSPDGGKVLTGSYNNSFSVFDTKSGAPLHCCDIGAALAKKDVGMSPSRSRMSTSSPTAVGRDFDINKKVRDVVLCCVGCDVDMLYRPQLICALPV